MKFCKRIVLGWLDRVHCGRPAKWYVDGIPCCGNHARINSSQVKVFGRVPIDSKQEASPQ